MYCRLEARAEIRVAEGVLNNASGVSGVHVGVGASPMVGYGWVG